MYSLERHRTLPLVLHNFLHFVNLSTERNFSVWKSKRNQQFVMINSILHSLCSRSCTQRTRLGQKLATWLLDLKKKKENFDYGKTNSDFWSMRSCSVGKSMQHWAKTRTNFLPSRHNTDTKNLMQSKANFVCLRTETLISVVKLRSFKKKRISNFLTKLSRQISFWG